jgi:hypothetical protein
MYLGALSIQAYFIASEDGQMASVYKSVVFVYSRSSHFEFLLTYCQSLQKLKCN